MERDRANTTSLDYDHARFHHPYVGRFLSPDQLGGKPEDAQSWNRYAYAKSNPLRYVDPNGRQSVDLNHRDPNMMYLSGQITREQLAQRPVELAPVGAAVAAGVVGFFAPEGLAALGGRSIPFISPLAAKLADFLGSGRGVTVDQSLERGLVSAGGKLETVLRGVEAGFGADKPTTALKALETVAKAAAAAGLQPGTLSNGPNGSFILQNVGGITTTILKTGEIIVTKGSDVLLRQIPQ